MSVETGSGQSLSYQYNTDGIRTGSTEGAVTTLYVVDTNRDYAQVISEVVNGVEAVNYLYGDDLISQQRNGAALYYHYDGLGSTRALTDATATITDPYDYEVLKQTGLTVNSFLYIGELYDFCP